MKRVRFKTKYSASWIEEGKTLFRVIPLSQVGIAIDVEDPFAELAIAEGAAVLDPGDGPMEAPPAEKAKKVDRMERGEETKGRRTK